MRGWTCSSKVTQGSGTRCDPGESSWPVDRLAPFVPRRNWLLAKLFPVHLLTEAFHDPPQGTTAELGLGKGQGLQPRPPDSPPRARRKARVDWHTGPHRRGLLLWHLSPELQDLEPKS